MGLIFKALKMLLAIILGIVYVPLNMLLMKIGGQYTKLKKTHPIDYWIIRIILFPLWAIAAILSVPYEWMVESAH